MEARTKIGIIGCGNISPAYFKGLALYPFLEVKACADMRLEAAEARAKEFGVLAQSVEELLADEEISLVVNLTIPAVHAPMNLRILEAGKHAYCEKPFALNRPEGQEVLKAAKEKGLRVGCAPDTFFGVGMQTPRKLYDDGLIGRAHAATANFGCPGHESWHPAPEFYYLPGGGPLLDMGPYTLTALVNILGPIKAVQALVRTTFESRTCTSETRSGEVIPVKTPTHFAGLLEFESDAVATVVYSFDLAGHSLPTLEIYGEKGAMKLPDPNHFTGETTLMWPGWKSETAPIEHTHEALRGAGVADMAKAIAIGRPHRASGELAYHVLDAMLCFYDAQESSGRVEVASTCERPAMLPVDLGNGAMD